MRTRKLAWLALLVVALFVTVALLYVTRAVVENRTYVIGWEVDPPDQVATETDAPTGFAVELVREAARRRGIRLKWVQHPESSEAALRSKAVDLWPMMVITEDRKKILHLTEPYQENEFGLFVDANSAFMTPGDLKQQTISYDGLPFNGRLLGEHFPGSVHLWTASLAEAVRSVCDGDAQAFFEDYDTVFSLLLRKPPCAGTSLRLLPTPPIRIQLGIGATRESGAAADAIREEIGAMASDGSMKNIVGVWSHAGSQELASLITLQQAKSHLQWYRIGLASVAALFLFAVGSAFGYRRQRIKAQAYGQALGLAERNVRLVADSLSEMVVAYDMHRSLTYANSGAEKLTGYGPAEMQVADPMSWTHPEDRSQVLPLWDKAFDGQTLDQVVYRLITKHGTVKWVVGSWSPVVDETGHQVGVRVTCLDITERIVAEEALQQTTQKFRTIVEEIAERKRAEEALRENEQRLVSIYNTVRDVIFHLAVEPEGQFRFVSVNAAFLRVTGLSLETMVGKTVNEVIPEPSLTMVLGKYRQAIEENTIVFWEETSDYPTGRLTGEVSVAPVFDNKGRCTHLVGSVHDITERKRVEATLGKSEERLKTAERLAHVGHWEWDCTTDRMVWSDEVCRIFGRPENYTTDYVGFLEAVQPYDRERVGQCVRDLMAEKIAKVREFQIARPDGEVRTLSSVAEVVRDERGLPVCVSGAWQDITDQKRAEAALHRSQDEVAHLNRVAAMGELTASLAHELNQPLAAILSNAQAANRFLNRESPNLAQVRECLNDIVADDKRAGEVIKTLRALLRRGEFQAFLVDLNEVVRDAIRLLGTDAMLRHASVKFEPLPALRPVLGDRTQLHQVVLNLIVNGLEATAERPPDNRWVLVRTAESEGGGVQLTVEDSGKGIAASDLARVFEPFHTTKQEGLGMGLSISRTILQAHGGHIWAENSAEHGAIVHCLLPVAQQGAAAATL
jgi:PAS domain S-box-containing protein